MNILECFKTGILCSPKYSNRKAKENDGKEKRRRKENINSLMCGMQKIKLIYHITGIPQY